MFNDFSVCSRKKYSRYFCYYFVLKTQIVTRFLKTPITGYVLLFMSYINVQWKCNRLVIVENGLSVLTSI